MTVTTRAVGSRSQIIAFLGPTNTGKTFHTIQDMLKHETGVIGFPLRLLARENYDKIVEEVGKDNVALLTGEEKIIPKHARYYICTVEAMPIEKEFDFLAVDEIQLCADPDRGHVFTDRLLRARGIDKTVFLGALTIKPIIQKLVPSAEFRQSPRLSNLEYRGYKKLTRLPKRSAVVAFSINDVYEVAEIIKRQRGGTALVLGALSPRTRNAQVEMYQNGEVDFLVATDAIGMGLNMDIHHVAFASTRKYDGKRMRNLTTPEIAQIAGRAGRYKRDGTFGVTGNVQDFDHEIVDAVQTHTLGDISEIYWRNTNLDFRSVQDLIDSLEAPSGIKLLTRGYPSDDYMALKSFTRHKDIMDRMIDEGHIRLLWDVCQVPDFRKALPEEHHKILKDIFIRLCDDSLPDHYIAENLKKLDNPKGNVDTLMTRLAYIRTWTYVTHRTDWIQRSTHWQEKAHAIEDRLSDSLHESLINRFVDRQNALLIKSNMNNLNPDVRQNGDVYIGQEKIGTLKGFSLTLENKHGSYNLKSTMTAVKQTLQPEIDERVRQIVAKDDGRFSLNNDGNILWQPDKTNPLPGSTIAKIKKGDDLYKPHVHIPNADLLGDDDKKAVTDKLQNWLHDHIKVTLEPMLEFAADDTYKPSVKGIAFQIMENMGVVNRSDAEDLIKNLDNDDRSILRKYKIRMGPHMVYMRPFTKPATIRLRAMLWSVFNGVDLPAKVPNDGSVSVLQADYELDETYARCIGYPVCGPRLIRVDMLDRIISAAFDNSSKGRFQATHNMAEWLGCTIEELYAILEGIGFKKVPDDIVQKSTPPEETVAEDIATEAEPAEDKPKEDVAKEEVPKETQEELKAEEQKSEDVKTEDQKAPEQKPDLAFFYLNINKQKPLQQRPAHKGKPGGKPPFTDKKNKKFADKKFGDKKFKGKGKREFTVEKKQKFTSENLKHNPFAMLQGLKSDEDK